MEIELSIVIPCYNEIGNLPEIFRNVKSLLDKYPYLEIILVDNGSSDGSAELIASSLAEASNKRLKSVTVNPNIGYGNGILQGLKAATGTHLGWTHADLQTDLADAPKAYEKLLKPAGGAPIFAKGNRRLRSPLDTLFTMGMSLISSWALKSRLWDINAQPKIFSRKFYHSFENPPLDFSLDLYVLYLAKKTGYTVKAIPVYFKKRLHGEAKGGGSLRTKWPLIKRTFKYIFMLKKTLEETDK